MWPAIVITTCCLYLQVVFGNVQLLELRNQTTNTDQCPAGFQLNIESNQCVQICGSAPTTTDNDTNLCNSEIKATYETLDTLTTEGTTEDAIVHLNLPGCKNITLLSNEFTVSNDGTLTVTIGKVKQTLSEFQLASANQTASICYPLSPQLLQCTLRRLNRQNYSILPGRTLVNTTTNETIGLRDYYTSPTSKDILACDEPINDNRKLRCNYINYQPDEYSFTEDNMTLWLLPTNTSIYRPTYTTFSDGTINVCYPFSPQFTVCNLWFLETHEFVINKDHTMTDTAHNIDYNMANYFIYSDGRAVVCSMPPESVDTFFDIYYIHAILYVISAICLFIAFVVHLLVPSLNYHAKPLLCHMICMLVMYISLAIRKFVPVISPASCYSLFVITYYSSMASFFWLNVLSFDLWSIFANLQTTSRLSCTCRCTKHRFYYYSLYSWGLPLLFCTGVIVLDTDPSLQEALHLYPTIPAMCWFNDRNTAYAFLYIPMFIVLIINLALFISTICNLRQASRGAEVVNKKLNKQLLFVCFKLFIIMGFCWIGEAIAWAAGKNVAAYYVPDAINAVQGVIIFIIYICKPATYRLLRDKLFRRKNSDGKWTTDFNNSRGKTSITAASINHRNGSISNGSVSSTGTKMVITHLDSLPDSKV